MRTLRVGPHGISRAKDDARGGDWPVWAGVLYGCRFRRTFRGALWLTKSRRVGARRLWRGGPAALDSAPVRSPYYIECYGQRCLGILRPIQDQCPCAEQSSFSKTRLLTPSRSQALHCRLFPKRYPWFFARGPHRELRRGNHALD